MKIYRIGIILTIVIITGWFMHQLVPVMILLWSYPIYKHMDRYEKILIKIWSLLKG